MGGVGGGRLALLSGLKEDRGGDRRERRKGGAAVTRMEHTGTHGLESVEKLLPDACDGGWGGGVRGLCLVMNSQEASPPVRHVSWSPIIRF